MLVNRCSRRSENTSKYGRIRQVSFCSLLLSLYQARGSAIVADASRDDTMVESLITFQTIVTTALTSSFSSDQDYRIASREAFKTFINTRQNKPAEMIAKFIDAKMRAGNKAMTDDELEKTFRNVLILFRYCQGKDIFEAFYKKDFAKRLLLNKSASSDAEKSMLLKLKEGALTQTSRSCSWLIRTTECGPGFTAKLETMAKDIDLVSPIYVSNTRLIRLVCSLVT